MFQSKFFSAEKVFPHVTAVTGLAGEKCYLVEGRDSALLIDAKQTRGGRCSRTLSRLLFCVFSPFRHSAQGTNTTNKE